MLTELIVVVVPQGTWGDTRAACPVVLHGTWGDSKGDVLGRHIVALVPQVARGEA